jgi:hypothetical protein
LLGALVASDSYEGPSLALEGSGMPGIFGDMVKLGELFVPAGTHLLTANVAAPDSTMQIFQPSGLAFAIGDVLVGLDANILPVSNSQQVVSVPQSTVIDIYGMLPPPQEGGPDYTVWFKAAAVRVSQQADPDLAIGDGIGPIFPPTVERQLKSMDRKMSQ